MDFWDGRYETSRDADNTLEDDISNAMVGYYSQEMSGGGTLRQTDTSINAYGPSDSEKGHWHEGVNIKGERYGHP